MRTRRQIRDTYAIYRAINMLRFTNYIFLKFYQFLMRLMNLLFNLLHESIYNVYKRWCKNSGYDYDMCYK